MIPINKELVCNRLRILRNFHRCRCGRPDEVVCTQDFLEFRKGLAGEKRLDDSHQFPGIFHPVIVGREFGVIFEIGPTQGLAEVRPVVLRVGHTQHNPAFVHGGINVADRIAHGLSLGPDSILAADQASGNIIAQHPGRSIVQ